MTDFEAAKNEARRYNTFDYAEEAMYRQAYPVEVLLGPDGLYWVPRCARHQSALEDEGWDICYGPLNA